MATQKICEECGLKDEEHYEDCSINIEAREDSKTEDEVDERKLRDDEY